MSRSLFAASLCLLSMLPAVGWAQDAAILAGPRAPEFRILQDSQWVRFTGAGVSRHQGMILEHEGPELVVSGEHEQLRIQATSIDTFWTRGHSAKQGAIIGSIAGALAGVALGLHYGATTTEHDFQTGQAGFLLGGIGAAGGGLIGHTLRPEPSALDAAISLTTRGLARDGAAECASTCRFTL
jgi:hypothetical protein